MIVHYLIDSSYILRISEEQDERRNVKNTIYINSLYGCLEQNGKILLDEKEILKGELEKILPEQSENESEQQIDDDFRIVLETFISNLTLSNCTYCPITLEAEQNDIVTIMSCLEKVNYYPDFIFTDTTNLNDSKTKTEQIEIGTLEQYFSSMPKEHKDNEWLTEQKRKKWLGIQSFDEKTDERFRNYLQHFSLGCNDFTMIDKMVTENMRKKDFLSSLSHIILSMSTVSHLSFKIISKQLQGCYYTPKQLASDFLRELTKKTKRTNLSYQIKSITTEFVLFGTSNFEYIHDRFVCSASHFFSIGRGVDVLKNEKLRDFNVFYGKKHQPSLKTSNPAAKNMRT